MDFLYNNQATIYFNEKALYLQIVLAIATVVLYVLRQRMIKKTAENQGDTHSGTISNKMFYVLLGIAAFIGVFVRVYHLGEAPSGINYDEAMLTVDAKALGDYGTDHYGMVMPVWMQAWKRGQQSAFMAYFTAPWIKLFGLNVWSVRLPMVFLSVTGAVFAVLLGKKAAVLSAFMIALAPWHIIQSRWTQDANSFSHLFIIGLYFLYKGLKKSKYLYIGCAVFGISMYAYGLSAYIVPVFLLGIGIYALLTKTVKLKTVLICMAEYFVISLPAFLCLLINALELDTIKLGFITIPRFYETTRASDILFFSDRPWEMLVSSFKAFHETVIRQYSGNLSCTFGEFGFIYKFALPLVVLGIVFLFTKIDKHFRWIVLFSLIACVFSALITPVSAPWRAGLLFYLMILLSAMGLFFMSQMLKKIAWINIVTYTIGFSMFVAQLFTSYADITHIGFFGGFGAALEYMETFEVDKYYVTSESQFKTSSDVSEILTLWYHEIDAEYYQGLTNEMDGVSYLPYNGRYIYSNIAPEDILPEENAAYLVTHDEKQFFDKNLYNFMDFRGWQVNYCVVTKK